MENWGIYSLDFPQSSPQGILDDKKKCRLESPQSSLWFPLAWVAGAQAKGKPQGKWGVCSPDFPQSSPQEILENGKSPLFFSPWYLGRALGKSGFKTPILPMDSSGLGGLGPKIYWGSSSPPTTKKFGYPALRNFQGFWGDQNSQNPLKGGGHPIHPGHQR